MKSSLEWMQDYVEIDKSRTPQEFAGYSEYYYRQDYENHASSQCG